MSESFNNRWENRTYGVPAYRLLERWILTMVGWSEWLKAWVCKTHTREVNNVSSNLTPTTNFIGVSPSGMALVLGTRIMRVRFSPLRPFLPQSSSISYCIWDVRLKYLVYHLFGGNNDKVGSFPICGSSFEILTAIKTSIEKETKKVSRYFIPL